MRERVLVEHGDGVAGAQGRGGDDGADAARSDDEDEHAARTLAIRRRSGSAAGGRMPDRVLGAGCDGTGRIGSTAPCRRRRGEDHPAGRLVTT